MINRFVWFLVFNVQRLKVEDKEAELGFVLRFLERQLELVLVIFSVLVVLFKVLVFSVLVRDWINLKQGLDFYSYVWIQIYIYIC